MGRQQRFLMVFVVATAAAPPLAAQLCNGLPMAHGRVGLDRTDAGTMTGTIAVRTGRTGTLSLNAANPDDAPNGSKSYSFGGRYYYGRDSRSGWGLCMLTGLQVGYAYLVNADGLRMNARIKSGSIPAGIALGRSIPATGSVRLVLFGKPQFLFQSSSIELYDRSDTTSTSEHPTRWAVEGGASLILGPLRVSATAFKIQDLPNGWTIGGGVAW